MRQQGEGGGKKAAPLPGMTAWLPLLSRAQIEEGGVGAWGVSDLASPRRWSSSSVICGIAVIVQTTEGADE